MNSSFYFNTFLRNCLKIMCERRRSLRSSHFIDVKNPMKTYLNLQSKMTIQLLKLYLELSILKNDHFTNRKLWKHTKFQLFIEGGEGGGGLGILTVFIVLWSCILSMWKIMKCHNFIDTLKYLWINTNKREWDRCKTYEIVLRSTPILWYIKFCSRWLFFVVEGWWRLFLFNFF